LGEVKAKRMPARRMANHDTICMQLMSGRGRVRSGREGERKRRRRERGGEEEEAAGERGRGRGGGGREIPVNALPRACAIMRNPRPYTLHPQP